jgi:anti-sigma regulatory factor (Ser/Thr protein kinase)
MGEKLQLTLAAELASLTAFRSFIDQACQEAKLDDKNAYDIKLAVDEACTNIIQHGYADMAPGSIILSLQYGVRQIVVRLTDFGHPFEPSEPPTPDVEAAFESGIAGGFGLYFIYRSMDYISYDSTGGYNTLTMIKQLDILELETNKRE